MDSPTPMRNLGVVCLWSCLKTFLHSISFLATTVQDVRLQLTQEDAAEAQRGIISPHKITLTAFLTTGLELEEQQ